MSDPAIEAAQKVLVPWSEDGEPEGAEGYLAEAAAREMAKSVQELHRPVHVVFSWTQGRILLDPCPCCGGKAGVHPCGCWGDRDIEYVCATCRDHKGRHVDFPCETAKRVYPSEDL
ncbi:hypothetical protein DDJ92_21440 [Mycobacteroides abscessus]|nr:hypothetical protein DDJ92_21440 [Mycobacteroides abscessus]